MQESPFYQLVIQRGIEQGARAVSIKNRHYNDLIVNLVGLC